MTKPWDDALLRANITDAFKRHELEQENEQIPTMNGVELLSQVKSLQPDSVRMIVSGNSDKSVLVEAINSAEIYGFIEKSWDNQQIIIDINEALTYRRSLLEKTILSNQMRQQLV